YISEYTACCHWEPLPDILHKIHLPLQYRSFSEILRSVCKEYFFQWALCDKQEGIFPYCLHTSYWLRKFHLLHINCGHSLRVSSQYCLQPPSPLCNLCYQRGG